MSDDTHFIRKNPKLLKLLERKQEALKRAVSLTEDNNTPSSSRKTIKTHKRKAKTITAYNILGVKTDAVQDEIFAAYRSKALQWHPDKHYGAQKQKAIKCFQIINAAFEKIKTEEKRCHYDRLLKAKDESAYNFTLVKTATANDNKHALAHKAMEALETIFWPFEGQNAKPNKDVDTTHFGL